ncbi:uncharacterized protein GIQ15_02665 [Arthroderma uncinatum]|uniref:uncharacterized protein n=1 Tax=Arthroderma uncinatum TaxID=74035 RepID=UPI00144A7D9B|nr:uncharacterized protein GIQ15_02665 [Arthroderma uncinatum]KAF3483341.1 hypothetical protein GIQ15_02665 [Arthroderma uncinatum]
MLQDRVRHGYNKNEWGDFPPNAYSSSAPRHDDRGYGRRENYPEGTRMCTAYNSYKAKDEIAEAATIAYNATADRLMAPRNANQRDGRAYGATKGRFFYPEDHARVRPYATSAKETAAAHSEARKEFNRDHIGRVTRDNYMGHRRQQEMAATSAGHYAVAERDHARGAIQERYPADGRATRHLLPDDPVPRWRRR